MVLFYNGEVSQLVHDNLYSLPNIPSPARESRCLVVGILDVPLTVLSLALIPGLSCDHTHL